MDVVHNDKIVGFNNFYFQKQGETFIVKNEVYFSISVLGVEVFKVKSNTEEEYKNNQLISFKSKTSISGLPFAVESVKLLAHIPSNSISFPLLNLPR